MSDSEEEIKDLFVQDGVLLYSANAIYINYLNTVGTLFLTEYDGQKYIEWKPFDVTVESEIQDQEWAVVNTVERRARTLSETVMPDNKNRSKYLKISFKDIKSFRITDKNRKITFNDGKTEPIMTFLFQNGNCDRLIGDLKTLFRTTPSKRDRHLFIILDLSNLETRQIDQSFAELKLCPDSPNVWKLLSDFHDRPVVTTFEAFAKITDYVYKSPEHREMDEDVKEVLERSLSEYENTTTHVQGDYEVVDVPDLPERKNFPRGRPLTLEQWEGLQDKDGKICDSECIKLMIFQGGVVPSMRMEIWKYLLDYYPWNSTHLERQRLIAKKTDEYYSMKLQWKTITKVQEDNFADFRDRKSQIEKDVNRTDRTIEYYAGDNNPNLQVLNDILMTYVMYNFDLGYVQGMSDLLSPILHLMKSEVDAFWCFVGFMDKLSSNFDADQAGMKEQLNNLHTILTFIDPVLANYFDSHDSGNMFFCFRWLLVWFKRELDEEDCMSLWEVLWTEFPCKNFHLLVCAAILINERHALMQNDNGFTEILKYINELSGQLDVDSILNTAQGIFYQIKESTQLNDSIRLLLGFPILGKISFENRETSPFEDSTSSQPLCSVENVRISPDEVTFDKSISSNFL